MPCRRDNIPYALARPSGGSPSAMGASNLATRIRPVYLQDAKATQECPPPPTFTVAAIRFRKHRGGESLHLKHVYPSGFCPAKASDKFAAPTESRRPPVSSVPLIPFNVDVPSTPPVPSDGGRHGSPVPFSGNRHGISVPFYGGRHGDLLYEAEGFGVPQSGAADKRRVVRFTRVLVGADVVADPAGSDLVQFGPGFPCGQTDFFPPPTKFSPRARDSTPLHQVCTAIDDRTVDGGGLFADDRKTLEEQLSSRAGSAGGVRLRDRGRNGQDGRKIIIGDRPATADRTVDRSSRSNGAGAGAGAGPLPRPTENTRGLSSSLGATRRIHDPDESDCTEGIDVGAGGEGAYVIDDAEKGCLIMARDDDDDGDDDDDNRAVYVKEGTAAELSIPPPKEDPAKPTAQAGAADENRREYADEPPRLSIQVNSLKMAGSFSAEDGTSTDGADGRGGGQPHHLLDGGRCARVGQALASSGGDTSVWNDESACSMLSVTTLEKASCGSSLSDGSMEQMASKRSFSSHETERYGGNLSKDATDILRSHLELKSKLSDDKVGAIGDASVPDSDLMQGGTAALMSPVPPPTPSDQLLDTLIAALPTPSVPSAPPSPPSASPGRSARSARSAMSAMSARSARFSLPPVGQARECYVRTKSEVVFAVVSKKELLGCRGDVDLQTLKASARSVRIKTEMTLKEGMRTITSSEARHDGVDGGRVSERGRHFVGGYRPGCPWGENGQARALEYYNSPAGAWEAVRSEHDWKLLLAAPAGPQGAGIALRPATEENGPTADFLVAISSPSVPPRGWAKDANRPEYSHSLRTTVPRKGSGLLPSCASKKDNSKEDNSKDNYPKVNDSKESTSGWPYATVVTPGALGPSHSSDEPHNTQSDDNGGSPNLKTTRGGRVGEGSEQPRPTPPKTCLRALDTAEQGEQPLSHSVHGTVHGTVGERRQTYFGSDEVLLAATNLQTAKPPSRRPKDANVRRLVQHLEARLKLKGQSKGSTAASRGRSMPHSKQLAKRQ